MNRLAGYEAAIVTPIPGTTRDVVRERISIDGMPLHVLDTAGLREGGDLVEEEGIRRAQAEMQRADRVLFVIDARGRSRRAARFAERARAPARGRAGHAGVQQVRPVGRAAGGRHPERAAAHHGLGAHRRGHRCAARAPEAGMGYHTPRPARSVRAPRHLEALARARARMPRRRHGSCTESRAGELVAEELRAAQQCLSEITGEFTSDDLLGRIFAGFCIGK